MKICIAFRRFLFTAVVSLFLLFPAALVTADSRDILAPSDIMPGKLTLIAGKSKVLQLRIPVEKKLRISLGDPDIADCLVLPMNKRPRELYIKAKRTGATNLMIWQEDQLIGVYDIDVVFDVGRLKQTLYNALPMEREIDVAATQDAITLMGKVSNAENVSKAVTLASAFAPKGRVNNLLTAGGTHQIMLEVKVAELSRSVGKDLGIDVTAANSSGDLGMTLLTPLHATTMASGALSSTYTSAVNALIRFSKGSTSWTAFIQALQEDGLGKLLAEPNLVSINGQTASFLAGGEYPIPVPNEDGITIDYKEFGVGLQFTPTVLGENRISITVNSEVSDLDFSTAVQYGGYVVPGITTRRAATTVQLRDGQSFAIAGLLSENVSENVKKFPFLGDIPILGTLFKSTSFQKDETELVIIVTPRFVRPLAAGNVPLPTEYYREPDSNELYLNFQRNPQPLSRSGKTDGQFGHAFETD